MQRNGKTFEQGRVQVQRQKPSEIANAASCCSIGHCILHDMEGKYNAAGSGSTQGAAVTETLLRIKGNLVSTSSQIVIQQHLFEVIVQGSANLFE